MKKKPAPLTKSYMPIVLWRDDLEHIISAMASRGSTVEIEAGEYSFETVHELAEHSGVNHPLTTLTISGRQPYVNVDLDRTSARLYVGADNNATGIFFEIDKVLAARQRRWPFLYSYWFMWLIIIGNAAWPIFVRNAFAVEAPLSSIASGVALLGWMGWMNFIRLRRHTTIRLERRTASKPFLQRNKDHWPLPSSPRLLEQCLGLPQRSWRKKS
jgi:hypothetical protein